MSIHIFVIKYQIFLQMILMDVRGGADKSLALPGKKQAQRPNSGFIQHTPHEAQCPS